MTERGYSSELSRAFVCNHRSHNLQLARATRELESSCGRATTFSLGKAMERASTLQCAVQCGCATGTITWYGVSCSVHEDCNTLRAHAEVVDVIRPSQSTNLLATNLFAVSNNMRYSLATMSTDFGAANCCIRTEANKLNTLSSLAHSTHGIKSPRNKLIHVVCGEGV